MPKTDMLIAVGIEAFILGYPFGIGVSTLPVWKRASIASEPYVFAKGRPYFSSTPHRGRACQVPLSFCVLGVDITLRRAVRLRLRAVQPGLSAFTQVVSAGRMNCRRNWGGGGTRGSL